MEANIVLLFVLQSYLLSVSWKIIHMMSEYTFHNFNEFFHEAFTMVCEDLAAQKKKWEVYSASQLIRVDL